MVDFVVGYKNPFSASKTTAVKRRKKGKKSRETETRNIKCAKQNQTKKFQNLVSTYTFQFNFLGKIEIDLPRKIRSEMIMVRLKASLLVLLFSIALVSIQLKVSFGSESSKEAYVTLLYGDEFLLGVRVLGKSIRETGSIKDMVALVSDGVSHYSKKLLKVSDFSFLHPCLIFFSPKI